MLITPRFRWLSRPEHLCSQFQRCTHVTSLMAEKGCLGVIPYLLRQLESHDPSMRWWALNDLASLKCREYRQLFIDFHLNDPDQDVRRRALIDLCIVFRGEQDMEILRLALTAFDNPASDVAMQLAAGAAMMYQIDVPEELGEPMWWDEEEDDLQHPALLWAVAKTRQLLAAAIL